ncbi:MAG: hypothetical protein ACR2QE_09750 [Acidimicrobiales bacterium]
MSDESARALARWRWPLGLIAVALVLGAVAGVLWQVEVTDDEVGATRACGSAFDVLADRSGWQVWWAADLDEPDEAVRAALPRTTRCPDAVNQYLIVSATMTLVGLCLSVAAAVVGRRPYSSSGTPEGRSLRRAGAVTAVIGAVLTVGGLIGLVVLVADADSTLFLYTDRLVVALVGVIVLIPALALTLGGYAVHVAGRRLDGSMDGPVDDE